MWEETNLSHISKLFYCRNKFIYVAESIILEKFNSDYNIHKLSTGVDLIIDYTIFYRCLTVNIKIFNN